MSALTMRQSMALRAAKASRPTALPQRAPRRSVVVQAGSGREWLLTQPGITAPTGFFDPAGLSESISTGEARRWRESELTHGRVAMLASLGWVVQERFHPFFGGQIGGPAFDHFQEVETKWPQFWEFIIVSVGLAEGYRIGVAYNPPNQRKGDLLNEDQIKANHTPGDLGFDPMGLYATETASQFDIRTKELNNGRLAMIAIAGFAAQELRDHRTILSGVADPAPLSALPPY